MMVNTSDLGRVTNRVSSGFAGRDHLGTLLARSDFQETTGPRLMERGTGCAVVGSAPMSPPSDSEAASNDADRLTPASR